MVDEKADVWTWRTFGPLVAVHFLGTLGFSLAIPFLVYIVADLGGASWTYGLLGATYSAFQFVGAPILGRWSDRAGRRRVLVASQAGTFAAWVLFLVALSIPVEQLGSLAGATLTVPLVLVFVARGLDGATGGNISVANAMVADLTVDAPELRPIAFGRMGQAASLGFVIGPAAAGLLGGTSWGPRLPIAVAALVAGMTTVAILALLRDPPRRCPEGAPHARVDEATLHQQPKRCDRAPKPRRSSAWSRPEVRWVLIGNFLLFLGFNVFYSGFPVHADSVFGWEVGELGAFFAALSLVMLVAQGPGLRFVSQHLAPAAVYALGLVLLAAALWSFQLPPGPWTWAGAVLFAAGNGFAWPTYQARIASVASEDQGAVQGFAASAGSLASILGLVVGAAVYPALGGGVFLAASGLFVVSALLTPAWFGGWRRAASSS